MEMIEEEKSRILTMKKRKKGLIKKLHQLTTLCDVPACMIFHDPTANSTSVWPEEDPDQVISLIEAYKAKKNDPSGGVREYLLSNFFDQRQRQAEEELEKLRKNNVEGMFPTWDDCLNFMDEAQLRELAATVRGKAENHNQQRRRERKHCSMEFSDYSLIWRTTSGENTAGKELNPRHNRMIIDHCCKGSHAGDGQKMAGPVEREKATA
ncbi:hypothetical protein SASPL_109538 [Salvia splendens]|uniref:MADS-box domain-containing protein n=1 Tax=Salvia splendens TaxID=180675 RepID=A0A8X9A9A2_SALSN|nr:hypothetical protein SASPL_109538 [Salvia splendens]